MSIDLAEEEEHNDDKRQDFIPDAIPEVIAITNTNSMVLRVM